MLWKTRQADTKSLWIIQKYELCEIRRLQNNTHVLFWGFFIYQLFGPKCSWKRALQQSEEDFAHCVWGWFFSFNITWKWKRKHLRRGSDLDERNSLCDQVKQNSEFRSDYVSSQKARSLLAGISQTERIYGLWLPGSFSPCLHLRCCNLHPSVHQSGCGQRVSFLAVNAHVFGGGFFVCFFATGLKMHRMKRQIQGSGYLSFAVPSWCRGAHWWCDSDIDFWLPRTHLDISWFVLFFSLSFGSWDKRLGCLPLQWVISSPLPLLPSVNNTNTSTEASQCHITTRS